MKRIHPSTLLLLVVIAALDFAMVARGRAANLREARLRADLERSLAECKAEESSHETASCEDHGTTGNDRHGGTGGITCLVACL
jgi:hypothetical protein